MTVNELLQTLILGEITLSQALMLSKVLFKELLSEDAYQCICREQNRYENPLLMTLNIAKPYTV